MSFLNSGGGNQNTLEQFVTHLPDYAENAEKAALQMLMGYLIPGYQAPKSQFTAGAGTFPLGSGPTNQPSNTVTGFPTGGTAASSPAQTYGTFSATGAGQPQGGTTTATSFDPTMMAQGGSAMNTYGGGTTGTSVLNPTLANALLTPSTAGSPLLSNQAQTPQGQAALIGAASPASFNQMANVPMIYGGNQSFQQLMQPFQSAMGPYSAILNGTSGLMQGIQGGINNLGGLGGTTAI